MSWQIVKSNIYDEKVTNQRILPHIPGSLMASLKSKNGQQRKAETRVICNTFSPGKNQDCMTWLACLLSLRRRRRRRRPRRWSRHVERGERKHTGDRRSLEGSTTLLAGDQEWEEDERERGKVRWAEKECRETLTKRNRVFTKVYTHAPR